MEMGYEHTRGVQSFMAEYVAGFKAVLDAPALGGVDAIIACLDNAYQHGQQVFVAGNGGSAATASHMACDLNKTVLGTGVAAPSRRLKVISLVDNAPLMTAWANDVRYDAIFAEQLRNLANPGDLLIVITASGNSPNIVAAVAAAHELGVVPCGLLGFDGGLVRRQLGHAVVVQSDNYGYIEDAHLMLTHLITAYLKARYTRGLALVGAAR